MDNVIDELIQMDKKAREAVLHAEEGRNAAKAEIARQRQAVYERYSSRSQQEIAAKKQEKAAEAREKLAKLEAEYQTSVESLRAFFAANGDAWAREIVKRCLD